MHLSEEQLILIYYGEAERDVHLDGCSACRDELARLAAVLDRMAVAPIPAPPLGLAGRVADRVLRRSFPWRRVAIPAAVAAMLVVAFQLGRRMPSSFPPAVMVRQDRILLVALPDHLERSRILLAEISHAPLRGGAEIERDRAEDLLESNRLYRQTAAMAGDTGFETLLDDLERILAEIAHSPDRLSGDSLSAIQRRLESQGLLFRIRIIESQMRERQENPLTEDRL